MRFSKKRIGGDRDGGIEGLPLQLMIMVIVAGLGTAVLVGWMGGLTAPEAISSVNCSPNEILLSDGDGFIAPGPGHLQVMRCERTEGGSRGCRCA